jgi:hypothetical protein
MVLKSSTNVWEYQVPSSTLKSRLWKSFISNNDRVGLTLLRRTSLFRLDIVMTIAHLPNSMAAIVGGVLTVASLVDALLFNTQSLIKKGAAAVAAEGKQPYQPAPAVRMM